MTCKPSTDQQDEVTEITEEVQDEADDVGVTVDANGDGPGIEPLRRITYNDNVMQTEVVCHNDISARTEDPANYNHQNAAQKLRDLARSQQTKVILEIGSETFTTSASVISKEESVLSRMVKKHSPLQPYFTHKIMTYSIDRDPSVFSYILDYLRVGPEGSMSLLPNNMRELRRIYVEASYYELSGLLSLLEKKVVNLLKGL